MNAYDIFCSGGLDWYQLKHQPITPGGRTRGIWEMELARCVTRQRVYIFFTCPGCGKIQRDLAEITTLERAVEAFGLGRLNETLLRACHSCRFCRKKIPYGLDNPNLALAEFKRLEKIRLGKTEPVDHGLPDR